MRIATDRSFKEITMLEKIEAIENLINRILEKIGSVLFKLFIAMIPKKVIQFIRVKKASLLKREQRSSNNKRSIKKQLQRIKIVSKKKFNRFLRYSHQRKFNVAYFEFRDYLFSKSVREHLIVTKNAIKRVLKKTSGKFSYSKNQVATFAMTFLFIMAGSVGVYQSSESIYRSEFPNRKPASVQQYDYRPEYKSYQARTTQIMNIKIPLLVEDVTEINSVTIDFTVRTTTRFSKTFLENYGYKLKDYFFTAAEPIASDFPLEEEGKDVLKEKITEELNLFLNENGVEGQVESIEITFIIAS